MQYFLMHHAGLQVLVVVGVVALACHPVLGVMLMAVLIRVIPCIVLDVAGTEHSFHFRVVWIVSTGRVTRRRTVRAFRMMRSALLVLGVPRIGPHGTRRDPKLACELVRQLAY